MSKKLKTFLLASLLLTSSLPVFSTDYITENLSTYMRKGAGDQYKISGSIQAGEKITLLDRKDRFVLIRDSRNREGWVLASEISQTASPKELIPQLQQQVQDLSGRLSRIDNDWQQRTVEMQRAIAIQYFIYGGVVLIAGLILGLLMPYILPRRKRNGWA